MDGGFAWLPEGLVLESVQHRGRLDLKRREHDPGVASFVLSCCNGGTIVGLGDLRLEWGFIRLVINNVNTINMVNKANYLESLRMPGPPNLGGPGGPAASLLQTVTPPGPRAAH